MARTRGAESPKKKVRAPVERPSTEADFVALKAGGIVRQRQKDRYTMRLKCPGGRMPLDRLARILEVARRYGGDHVHLSARQSIEIPYVPLGDTDRVRRSLAEVGQEIASCGARVRVPTACAGCELNPLGLVDTQRMARLASDQFFGQGPLPHKFKMAFSG
jgi:anaerobic sulfite reductase subunit C